MQCMPSWGSYSKDSTFPDIGKENTIGRKAKLLKILLLLLFLSLFSHIGNFFVNMLMIIFLPIACVHFHMMAFSSVYNKGKWM